MKTAIISLITALVFALAGYVVGSYQAASATLKMSLWSNMMWITGLHQFYPRKRQLSPASQSVIENIPDLP